MADIIVAGHGNFASGILSSARLIAGDTSDIIGIDFLESYSTEKLKQIIKEAVNQISDEVIILTDLAGGSPYNVSVMIKMEHTDKNIEVIAGINLPILLSCIFGREGIQAKELAETVVTDGKDSICSFALKAMVKAEEEEGI